MDTSKYLDLFVSESREYLDKLNGLLVSLEERPEDKEIIDAIFRAFHTLKGNSLAMGYQAFSDLAHKLEDVLSQIRDKRIAPDEHVISCILEGCDIFESSLKSLESGGEENIDAMDLIDELNALGRTDKKRPFRTRLTRDEKEIISKLEKEGKSSRRFVVSFKEGVPKVAKTLLILRELKKDVTIIRTEPSKEELVAGDYPDVFQIVLASEHSDDKLKNIINSISGVSRIDVISVDEVYVHGKTTHEEKEYAKHEIIQDGLKTWVRKIREIKVKMSKLDKLMDLAGDLVVHNMRLYEIYKNADYDRLSQEILHIEKLSFALQDEIMDVRMIPLRNIFNRFPRMVRDIASQEGKKVIFEIEGQDIESDRTILDEIGDPLVHLLRNCIDHGIEPPDIRKKLGKPESGHIKIVAKRERNSIVMQIMDDGAGIDGEKLKEICLEKKIITPKEAISMDEHEKQMLCFRPGISTSKEVTDVSGRGVGMDVVQNTIEKMGGSIVLDSVPGKGTTTTLILPLSLAIINVLLIRTDLEQYAVPLSAIKTTMRITADDISTINGVPVLLFEGEEIPLYWLNELLGYEKDRPKEFNVMIVNKDSSMVGLLVHEIIAQKQVVVKPLSGAFMDIKGISGSTILGDGKVTMIIDTSTLL